MPLPAHYSDREFPVPARRSARRRAGVTLVELMIAMAILTIGIVGLVQSFSFIQKAVQLSKNKTLASNLAQEKMQILKQKPYYQVIATSVPAHNDIDFAPESIDYDNGYFPPEMIMEGGVTYTRYTYVQVIRENEGAVGDMAPSTPDTGMKRITITVVWGYGTGGKRRVTLRSIMANPETVIANASFNGTVLTTAAAAIGGGLISLVEASGCSDTTSSLGKYLITCTPGTYTLMAAATGYYSLMKSVVIAAGGTQTNDFTLNRVGVGTVRGYPWLNDHLVISQVVGSTINTSVTPNFDQEYVEVFNPTPNALTMNGNIGLKFQRAADPAKRTIQISYITPTIESGGYYLFANTGTVTVAGTVVDADAVWAGTNSTSDFPYFAAQTDIIPVDEDGGGEGGGALELYRLSDGAALDKVGWDKTGYPAPFHEGTAIVQTVGLSRNELYARFTSTADAAGVSGSYGPAYDSNSNSVDFYDYSASISIQPHSSDSGVKPVISGTPAAGAVATCSDGLSSWAEAALTGSPPAAYFSLTSVATGYWTVAITSGTYNLTQTTVPVVSAGSVYTFASTSTFLSQNILTGLVSGRVVNVLGSALSGIVVTAGGANTTSTDSNGRYRLVVNSGSVDVTANPVTGGSASYVNASSASIRVDAGEVHGGVDFVLYQGGRIKGFVTRDGTNGLPGVSMAILDYNSVARDVQVTGSDGRFVSVVLSTGYYTVQPSLGTLENSSPVVSTATITTAGGTVFSSSFTISGAMGAISGTVSFAGQPIKSGVLIVVTTTTVTSAGPPDINSATLTGPPFYMVSSMENGTYLVEVRTSTSPAYKVYAYYPVAGSTGTVVYTGSALSVPVTAGQTYTGVNFSW
ncbi:MAG: carboxypeptidase regulatory-like domain-containing protein [Elusimicrobiota bacterium]